MQEDGVDYAAWGDQSVSFSVIFGGRGGNIPKLLPLAAMPVANAFLVEK